MMRSVFALALAAITLSPGTAAAEQTLYRETPEGWFIYVEDNSCVMYADLSTGTMLRFSNRVDQNRVYFTAVNEEWAFLRPRIGQTLTLSLEFHDLQRWLGAASMVIENPDGRLGYTANDFPTDVMLRFLSTGGRMSVHVMLEAAPLARVEVVNLNGAAVAVTHLVECTERHFPEAGNSGR